jgi:hypothetical protein
MSAGITIGATTIGVAGITGTGAGITGIGAGAIAIGAIIIGIDDRRAGRPRAARFVRRQAAAGTS